MLSRAEGGPGLHGGLVAVTHMATTARSDPSRARLGRIVRRTEPPKGPIRGSQRPARRRPPLCGGGGQRLGVRDSMSGQYALLMLRWLPMSPEDFLVGPTVDVSDVALPEESADPQLRWISRSYSRFGHLVVSSRSDVRRPRHV